MRWGDPEDHPDEYYSELDEEIQDELPVGEFADEYEERQRTVELLHTSIVLARLLEEEYITLREYVEMSEPLEEYSSDQEGTYL